MEDKYVELSFSINVVSIVLIIQARVNMRSSILAAAFLATVQAQSGPVDPSTTKDCTFYWDAVAGDTCAKMEGDWGISHAQFVKWVGH